MLSRVYTPKINGAHDFGQLKPLIANISATNKDIDQRKANRQLRTLSQNLVRLSRPTTKFNLLRHVCSPKISAVHLT